MLRLKWGSAKFIARLRIIAGIGAPQITAVYECAQGGTTFLAFYHCRRRYQVFGRYGQGVAAGGNVVMIRILAERKKVRVKRLFTRQL